MYSTKTHFYGLKFDWLEQECNTSLVMLNHHHTYTKRMGYKVEHFLLVRKKPYNPAGRLQTEEEAVEYDTQIKSLLESLGIKYNIATTVDDILKRLIEPEEGEE